MASQVAIVPILSFVLAIAFAGFALARGPRPITFGVVADRLLQYIFLFPVGLMGLWAALGHIVFPERAAAAIGWATSPFQTEVGFANLGIGLLGLVGAFRHDAGYRLAGGLVILGFLGGAAAGHIRQIVETGNMAAGNAGPILYTDILIPLSILVLLPFARPPGRA